MQRGTAQKSLQGSSHGRQGQRMSGLCDVKLAINMQTARINSTCSHYHQSDNEMENCFQLVGYPDWWPKNPSLAPPGRGGRGSASNRSGGRGYFSIGLVAEEHRLPHSLTE